MPCGDRVDLPLVLAPDAREPRAPRASRPSTRPIAGASSYGSMPDASSVVRKPVPGRPEACREPGGPAPSAPALAAEFSARETTREGERRDPPPAPRGRSTVTGAPTRTSSTAASSRSSRGPTRRSSSRSRPAVRPMAPPAWQFAAARVNSITLVLDHKGREAWSVPTLPWSRRRTDCQPYTLFRVDPDAEDPGR